MVLMVFIVVLKVVLINKEDNVVIDCIERMNRERRKEKKEEEKINVKRRQDGERGRKKRKKKERERWTNNHIKELIIFKIFLFSFYNRTVSKND